MKKKSGIDMQKFDKMVSIVKGHKHSPPIKDAFKQWGTRYLSNMRRRFIKNSKGGGEWPPLKSVGYRRATGSGFRKARTGRRKTRSERITARTNRAKARGRVTILRDTGTLLASLSINQPGNLFNYLTNGIRVGFSGRFKHPSGQRASVADIAVFHQKGKGNLPQRKILHKPSDKFAKWMCGVLGKAIDKAGRTTQ